MSGKTIVVLGAGVGGLVAANELRRLLPPDHRVVLVEKNARHAFAPSFLWLMTGARKPDQISRDVRQLVRRGIEVDLAEAQAIDVTNRTVQTSTQTLHFDYLIVALGAELAPDIMPDLDGASHTFYTFHGAGKLRDVLRGFEGGKVALVVSALPYKCPGAPHEGAMLIADTFRKRGIHDKSEVHLFTPEPQPMPVAGATLGEAVKEMLAKAGVHFHPLHKLTGVNALTRELTFERIGASQIDSTFKYDLLIAIPPHRSPRVVRDSGLTNEAGWIPVNRETLQTQYENVYALGDVTAISIPGRWKPEVPLMLPKAGVFAHTQAEVVAQRIADEISGSVPDHVFCGDGYCMLEAGGNLGGFAFGNFFAEPSPQIELRNLGTVWHLGKVLFEQWWLAPHGLKREALRLAITLGSKGLNIPVKA